MDWVALVRVLCTVTILPASRARGVLFVVSCVSKVQCKRERSMQGSPLRARRQPIEFSYLSVGGECCVRWGLVAQSESAARALFSSVTEFYVRC